MTNWLNQLSKKRTPKTRRLWEHEFSIVEEGLDEMEVIAFVNALIARHAAMPAPVTQPEQKSPPEAVRSIIERAVTDAEQLAASIKRKAQKEVEDESARIIANAKQGAEEIRRRNEAVTQKETEDILAALNAKTRLIEDESKRKVESLLLQARQEIEKQIREEYKEGHSRLLRSLMRGAEEMLPAAEVPATLQKAQKPGLVINEPIAKKSTGEAVKPKMPASSGKEKLSWLTKIWPREKTDEAKKAEEARRQVEKEAKLAAMEETKKKAQEARKTEEARKQEEKEANLAAMEETKKNIEEAKQAAGTQTPVVQEAESPVAESTIEKNEEIPVPPKIEAAVPKPVESIVKALIVQPRPEKSAKPEPAGSPQKLDPEAIYEGEIELAVAVPVDPAAVSKLYNYLQSTPDMKILYTRGSWDRGTTITVSLDKPLPFIGMISKITGLKIAPGVPQKENLVKGTSGSLLGAKRKEVAKIDLILKAE